MKQVCYFVLHKRLFVEGDWHIENVSHELKMCEGSLK